MTENELQEFCEKNEGKKIRVDDMVLEAGEWDLRPSGVFIFYYPNVHGILLAEDISSLTVEGDND